MFMPMLTFTRDCMKNVLSTAGNDSVFLGPTFCHIENESIDVTTFCHKTILSLIIIRYSSCNQHSTIRY